MAKPEKKEVKERFVVVQVTTQTAPAIIDTTKAEDDEERIVGVYPPEDEGKARVNCKQLNYGERMTGLL